MKALIFLICISFLTIGCEDKITEPNTKYINQSSICPITNPESEPSSINFKGISDITNISTTSATLHWEHLSGIHLYNIILITHLERRIIKTILSTDTDNTTHPSYQLNGLLPNTEYQFLIRATDKSGFSDVNTNVSKFKTLPWPNFSNQRSIELNGSQNITLAASDKYLLGDNFAVSLWFKTSHQNDERNATRLITFHASNNNSKTALSIAVKDKNIQLKYIDQNLKPKTKSFEFDYHDNQWHHLVLSSTHKVLRVYIDKTKVIQQKVKLIKFGSHPASIGSRSGIWNGFVGRIDEVAMYNTSFNPHHVKELYNNGTSIDHQLHSRAKNLIHWYQLGDQANDSEKNIVDVIGDLSGSTVDDNFNFVDDTP